MLQFPKRSEYPPEAEWVTVQELVFNGETNYVPVLELSDASIMKQLRLDESEWSDMVADQRQMITTLQNERDVYKEVNRILLRENLDLRDTLEDNNLLNEDQLQDLKELFSPLAEMMPQNEEDNEDGEDF